jgi:hypothetical protein
MLFCFFLICGLCLVSFVTAQLEPEAFAKEISLWCHIGFVILFFTVNGWYAVHIRGLIAMNSKHVVKDSADVAVDYQQHNQRQRLQRADTRRSIRVRQSIRNK